MACSDNMWELLKEFSLGNLEGDDFDLVLSHIDACPACSDDLEVLSSLAAVARERGEALLDMEWVEAGEKAAGSRIPGFFRKLKVLFTPVPFTAKVLAPVAVAVIVILTYGTYLSRNGDYASFADLTPAPYMFSTLRSGVNEKEELIALAMKKYRAKDYEGASRSLSLLLEEEPEYDERVGFYLGVSLLLSGDVEGAVSHLRKTAGSSNHTISHKSRWYLAQAALLEEDKDTARSLLEEVAGEEGDYSGRARELLGKIKGR